MQVRLFEQDHGFIPSLGLRIGNFGYSTDVVSLDDAAFAALEGVDTWVVGCFLRRGPHKTHADLAQVLDVGAPRRRAPDGADAYGHRHGLELAGGESAGGHRAGPRRHGARFNIIYLMRQMLIRTRRSD